MGAVFESLLYSVLNNIYSFFISQGLSDQLCQIIPHYTFTQDMIDLLKYYILVDSFTGVGVDIFLVQIDLYCGRNHMHPVPCF